MKNKKKNTFYKIKNIFFAKMKMMKVLNYRNEKIYFKSNIILFLERSGASYIIP